jgi:ELWxxDGT repeat protein
MGRSSLPPVTVFMALSYGRATGRRRVPVLVKDIHPGAGSSGPSELANVNGTLFFAADDGVHGRELWKSDGTEAGTVLVKDINTGMDRSYPIEGFPYYLPYGSSPHQLVNVNGTLLFWAYGSQNGPEALWKSDGTAAGTVLVKNISDVRFSDLTQLSNTLFFTRVNAAGLWKSDGTAAGTVLVKGIKAGEGGVNMNGTLFFVRR